MQHAPSMVRHCMCPQLLAIQLLLLLSSSGLHSGAAYVPGIGVATAAARTLHADVAQLPAGSTLYCALTGECKVCSAKHLKSEACRPTGFAEHLSCWLRQEDVDGPVILVTATRPVSTEHVPLHMPRSCKPAPTMAPKGKGATAPFQNTIQATADDSKAEKTANSAKAVSQPSTDGSGDATSAPEAGGGKDSSGSGTSSSSSSASDTTQSKKQRSEHVKLMPDESHYLSTITFEACMLVLLACSLPVVYWRKAKLRRPG